MSALHKLPQMIPSCPLVLTAVHENGGENDEALTLHPVEDGSCPSLNGTNGEPGSILDLPTESDHKDNTEPHSRYGRVRKRKSLGPDMELMPLVRQNKRNRSDTAGAASQTKLDHWLTKKSDSGGDNSLKTEPIDSAELDTTSPGVTKGNGDFDSSNVENEGSESREAVVKKKQTPQKSNENGKLKGSARKLGRPPKKGNRNTLQFSPCENISTTPSADSVESKIIADNTPRTPSNFDFLHSTDWNIGDLLWSKITGHPWWPCMVAFNPFSGTFFRIVKRKSWSFKVYHVQYFGSSAQHGWTMDGGVMAYEGREAFDGLPHKLSELPKTPKRDRLLTSLKIAPSRVAQWEIAIAEAEIALKMTREERVLQYTFEYKLPSGERCIPGVSTPTKPQTPQKKKCLVDQQSKTSPVAKDNDDRELKINGVGKEKKKHSTDQQIKSVSVIKVECKDHETNGGKEQDEFPEEACTSMMHEESAVNFTKVYKYQEENVAAADKQTKDTVAVQKSKENSPMVQKQKEGAHNGRVKTNGLSKTNGRHKKSSAKDPDFEIYLSKHLEDIVEEHPEFSLQEAEAFVLYQWNNLSVNQKACYTSKNDIEPDPESLNGYSVIPAVRQRTVKRNGANEVLNQNKMPSSKDEQSNGESGRHDKVCSICEVTGSVIVCRGPCMQSFHRGCLGLASIPPTFECDECLTGKHKCFSCKTDEGVVQKCSISSCGKYYHRDCLNKIALSVNTENRIVCSLHTCHSCFLENPKSHRCRKGRMVRCVRCPTAYHSGETCVAAGSISLTSNYILCAKHFHPQKNNKFHLHINATWCFICSEGGNLICCESCPGAFHPECLNISPPEGSYYCTDCTDGKQPRYGDIVWVKLGCYRWWPAEIQHPDSVPINIQNLEHNVGEFPVRFYGSHDYFWMHKGRVFLFHEGDKGSKDSSSGRYLAQVFQRAVEEATEAFQEWILTKESRVAQTNSLKPPLYKHIKCNRPVGKVQITPVDPATLTSCECNPDDPNPCSSDTECMNRILMFECHPNVCKAGEKCRNQRFQKREYAAAKPFRTEGRGWGLQSEQDIKQGEFVSEYVGELIDEKECESRLKKLNEENDTNFYFLTIEKDKIIDAGPKGNFSRFMNHSCQPNCETQKWMVDGDTRVGLFAVCDIPAGSELTFNYNLDCCGNEKVKCSCGSTNCSGFLGLRPKTANAVNLEKKARENKSMKKKKKSLLRKHDDECYRCGEGGELMMCDRKTCTKSYHLNCLGLTKPSHGRWECPWHHCDVCGNASTILCSYCPNSFCKEHAVPESIWTEDSGQVQCSEHADDDRLPSSEEST